MQQLNRHLPRQSRVSIACLQCRQRHLKCDAATPICHRCHDIGSQCTYLKSRRGGRPRQSAPPSQTRPDSTTTPTPTQSASQIVVAATLTAGSESDATVIGVRHRTSNSTASLGGESNVGSIDNMVTLSLCGFYTEPLLQLYYDNFHSSHPCVLPIRFLKERSTSTEATPGMSLLIAVMRFIGSLYSPTIASSPLDDEVRLALTQLQPWTSGYEIQAITLYSIATFWCDDLQRSKELLDLAASKALAVGMNLQPYAVENSGGDAVLAESLRRTWWQIYITDLHITATNHEINPRISRRNTIVTVDLPCEECEYMSGNIPQPRTLEEYDHREFATDGDVGFSSYAYLIGLLQSLDLSIFGISRHSEANVKSICTNADASMAAWLSLLPKAKRKLFAEDGTFDELLFKATSLLQVYTIDIHRQLSTLTWSPVEETSSCAPRPPPEHLENIYYVEAYIHTAKILCAIEKMTNLLTLPTKILLHTPFTICIVGTITIAHLSACKFVLKGKELQIARERIRVAMGTLETFAEVWPRAKKVVKEVKTIARELLRLPPEERSTEPSEDGILGISNPYVETALRILSEKPVAAEADFLSSLDGFGFVNDGSGLGSFFPVDGDGLLSPQSSSVPP